jgi:hypothetical protein
MLQATEDGVKRSDWSALWTQRQPVFCKLLVENMQSEVIPVTDRVNFSQQANYTSVETSNLTSYRLASVAET